MSETESTDSAAGGQALTDPDLDGLVDLPPGCELLLQGSLARHCARPAVLHDTKLILNTEVTNKMRDEKSIGVYNIQDKWQCQVVLANKSDLEVTLACQEILAPMEVCDNAAGLLGSGSVDSITIDCQPGGSWARDRHPDCDHGISRGDGERKRAYRCSPCGRIVDSMKELLLHQREIHHGIKVDRPVDITKQGVNDFKLVKGNCNSCCCSHILGQYSCDNCEFSVTCPFGLEAHMKNVHDTQQVYRCPVCAHENRFYTAMEKHLFEKHLETKKVEKGRAKSPLGDVEEEEEKEEKERVDVSISESITKHEPAYSVRSETKVNEEDLEKEYASLLVVSCEPRLCAFCGARFHSDQSFRIHLKCIHFCPDDASFRCCLCAQKVFSVHALGQHFLNYHRTFYQVFLHASDFGASMRMNAAEVIVKRSYKKYVYALDTKTIRKNFPEIPIKSRVYKGQAMLDRVAERCKYDSRQWYCAYCPGSSPKLSRTLVNHAIQHTQYWPYWCQACNRKFKHKLEAATHVDVSGSTLKSRQCQVAKINGLTPSFNLKVDDLRKQNEQVVILLARCIEDREEQENVCSVAEFWCGVCKFMASHFCDMVSHMTAHTDQRPYSCSVCAISSATRLAVKRHIDASKCHGHIKFLKVIQLRAEQEAKVKATECTTMVEFTLQRAVDSKETLEFEGDSLFYPAYVDERSIVNLDVDLEQEESGDFSSKNIITYECKRCHQSFKSMSQFRTHAPTCFSDNLYQCSKCYQRFALYTGRESFTEHVINKHPESAASLPSFYTMNLSQKGTSIETICKVVTLDAPTQVISSSPASSRNKRKQSMDTFTYVHQKSEPEPAAKLPNYSVVSSTKRPAELEDGELDETGESYYIPESDAMSKTETRPKPKLKSGARKHTGPHKKRVTKAECEITCPQCGDFEGAWDDLVLHYEAMHSDMAVCLKCDSAPCFHLVDYYKHLKNHGNFKVSDMTTKRADPRTLPRDLIEQLGSMARARYGTVAATKFINCQLLNVKLTPKQGLDAARFVCRQCLHTSRSTETYFSHIAEHLKISQFHCLHCTKEGNAEELNRHYRDEHGWQSKPTLLPYSVQYRKFKNLVDSIVDTLTEQNGADYEVGKKGSNEKDPFSASDPDAWTFMVTCPHCEFSSENRLYECMRHVEVDHPRKQQALDIDLRLALPAADAKAIMKTSLAKESTRKDAAEKINRTYKIEPEPKPDTTSKQPVVPVSLPESYEIFEMDHLAFSHRYNESMLALYNHFSILEVVAITGTDLRCQMCSVAQETFPALFEHWSRTHLTFEPYACAQCGLAAKRPSTVIGHERRLHGGDGRRYAINIDLEEELFSSLETFLKQWLRLNKVDSHCPDDWKLVSKPKVKLESIENDERYSVYCGTAESSKIMTSKSSDIILTSESFNVTSESSSVTKSGSVTSESTNVTSSRSLRSRTPVAMDTQDQF